MYWSKLALADAAWCLHCLESCPVLASQVPIGVAGVTHISSGIMDARTGGGLCNPGYNKSIPFLGRNAYHFKYFLCNELPVHTGSSAMKEGVFLD